MYTKLSKFRDRLKRATEYASIYGNHPVNSFVESELEELWKSFDFLEKEINGRLIALERNVQKF